ncbi:MAG TPA: hypothetical protein VLN44_06610 [Pyrinomonadaceae bacterium]|nr:hypothetical protein [Pyrinomonadaceae bacterium]
MGHLTAWFDREFLRLQSEWRELIRAIEPEKIYQRPSARGSSFGEYVVRSARAVEQTFGGITANLWDDPFEWTLPENLTTPEKLLEYFDEVGATRQRGFALFKNDEDLMKEVMTPSGKMQLASLLLDTLVRARHHQLKAREVYKQIKAGAGSFAQKNN